MREIKFRAWDKKKKVLFPVHELKFNRVDYSLGFLKGYTDWEKDGWTTEGGGIMKYANQPRYDLMQYTGLKDRYGNEIYEGDIVIGINRINEAEIEQEVTFLNGCFMFGNWNAHEYFNKHTQIFIAGNKYEKAL